MSFTPNDLFTTTAHFGSKDPKDMNLLVQR
jgi:hypothetical protein